MYDSVDDFYFYLFAIGFEHWDYVTKTRDGVGLGEKRTVKEGLVVERKRANWDVFFPPTDSEERFWREML